MLPLSERIAKANALLRSSAVLHADVSRRAIAEESDGERFAFARDRDRIIHAQAFRRLKGKTQVFVSGHGDHYRTRITHTLEVAQISRDMARAFGLNEDLAEAIALAHDLGHTPFGHAGEEAMRMCMESCGKTFEHNEQSLRIVTLLEERSSRSFGLNLSQEVLEGLMKHRAAGHGRELAVLRAPTLEAQLVDVADEIAYTAHDTDDGLRAGLVDLGSLNTLSLTRDALLWAESSGGQVRSAIVHLLLHDLYEQVERLLLQENISSLNDVYEARVPLVSFSPVMSDALSQLRDHLRRHVYMSDKVRTQAERGKQAIATLFHRYIQDPPEKVRALQQRCQSGREEAVKDYIAGMTDDFALKRAASST